MTLPQIIVDLLTLLFDMAVPAAICTMVESARSRTIMFKLMNATKRVGEILELTCLQRVFEFCSVRELFCLLHRTASMPPVQLINPIERMKTTAATVPWNGQKRFQPSKPPSADTPADCRGKGVLQPTRRGFPPMITTGPIEATGWKNSNLRPGSRARPTP